MTIKNRLNNRAILVYTITRYLGLGVLLFRGILLAKYLGPTLFGVWGFLNLLLQYLAYSNFGIQHSTTVELSNKDNSQSEDNSQLTANALGFSLLLFFALSLLGLGIQISGLAVFDKYAVNRYILLIGVLAGFTHITTLLTSVYRAYGAVYQIALFQFIDAVLPLAVLWLAQGETLVLLLLAAMIVSQLIGLGLFIVNPPCRLSIAFDRATVMRIIAIGLPLLVYNASFNMITMIGRTLLSAFYSVEVMGYYSLANSITNAVLLGLRSVAFVLLPDVIYRTRANVADSEAAAMAEKANNLFGTSAYLLAYALIIGLPFLLTFIPEYRSAEQSIGILVLAQAMLSTSFGYNAAALARGYQLQVAKISIAAVVLVGGFSLLFAWMGLEYFWIAIAVWIGATVFSFFQGRLSLQMLNCYNSLADILMNRLWVSGLLSTLLFVTLSYLRYDYVADTLAALSFVAINWKNIRQLAKLGNSYVVKS